MKLPGYKPKPCPPNLPPKERQRRHSDSVATLTESGVAPFVEDGHPIENLRPKHNSVSNAIYHEYVWYMKPNHVYFKHFKLGTSINHVDSFLYIFTSSPIFGLF